MSLRWMAPRYLTALLALVALSGAGGCVDNDISLSIEGFVPQSAGTCSIEPSVTSFKGGGVLDARIADSYGVGYLVPFVVQNQLTARSNIAVDVQAYYIEGYDVELQVTGPAEAVIPAAQRTFFAPAATVRLGPQDSVGQSITVLRDVDFGALANATETSDVLVRLRPVATRAEERVNGAYSNFPITLCSGCLIANRPLPTSCPIAGTVPDGLAGNECNPAADEPIGCCSSGGVLTCGAAAYAGL